MNLAHSPNLAQDVHLLDGRYLLHGMIGSGGVGTVYHATQTSVSRSVAVKLLHAGLSHDQESLARFDLEAKALARLNDPRCVTLFDFGHDKALDAYYMVMEFIKGEDFSRAQEVGLSASDELKVLIDVCHALKHAHAQGITHRDLKPSNIMIPADKTQSAKVLDFGLARLFQETLHGERLSVSGRIYGTPAYMSPEQCRGDLDIGPAADVYALGMMLYEVIEGRLPFEASSVTAILLMHIQNEVELPQNARFSHAVRQLCVDMTAQDPERRLVNMDDIILTLEYERELLCGTSAPHILPLPQRATTEYAQTLAERPLLATPTHDTPLPLLTTPLPRHALLRWGAIAAAALCVIGLLVGLAFTPSTEASTTSMQKHVLTPRVITTERTSAETERVPTVYVASKPEVAKEERLEAPLEERASDASPSKHAVPPRRVRPRARTLSLH